MGGSSPISTITVGRAASMGQNARVGLRMARQGLDREVASSLGVTRRENEVLGAVIARLTNAEIAADLFISERTVESHVSALLHKLDARDRSELIERATDLAARLPRSTVGAARLAARLTVRPLVGLVVGRSAELAVLGECVKRVGAERRTEVVVVIGEAGVGKTTLIAQAARSAFNGGACVLLGHCEEDLAAPYQLFAEALGQFVDDADGDVLTALVGSDGTTLTGLLPGLVRRMPGIGGSTAMDGDAARYELFAAVVELLARLSAYQPVVLVFEDLQWADRASLQLLRHLVGSERSMQLLVVVSCRDGELSRAQPIVDTLADIYRLGRVTRVELGGLGESGVAAYVAAASAQALDDSVVAFAGELYRETGGNPFFVGEVLRHLVETGALVRGADGRWSAAADAGEMPLPPSVHAVIRGRVGRLGGEAERVVSLAATIGRDFGVELLTAAAGSTDDDVLGVLDAGARAALVREMPDTPGHYSFVHALIQHTVYAQLGPTRQARAHRQIAEALEVLSAGEPAARVGELARHWSAAAHPNAMAKALHYTRLAADSALAAMAPADALGYYRRALDLHEQLADSDPLLGLDLTIGLGLAQRQTGHAEFRDTLLRAARWAADLGDTDRLAAAALANHRGMFSVAGIVDGERVEILELAIAQLPRDHPFRPLLLAKLCSELNTVGTHQHRQELATEAITLARSTGDDATIVRVLNDVSWPLTLPRLLEQSLAHSAEALHRAERLGDPVLLFWAAHLRAGICLRAGDVAEMERCYAIAWDRADHLDQPVLSWLRDVMKAACALLAGDTAAAETLATKAQKLGTDSGQPDARVMFALQLSAVRTQRGVHSDDKIPAIESILIQLPGAHVALTAALAQEHARVGRLEIAHSLLDRYLTGGLQQALDPGDWLATPICYIDVAIACGDDAAADSLYELLVPFTGQVQSNGVFPSPPVDHHLGRLATLLRRYDQADAHFTRAANFAAHAGAAYFAAETDLAWATMLLQRSNPGDDELARSHLDSARSVAQTNGYADIEQRATELLQRLPGRTGPS